VGSARIKISAWIVGYGGSGTVALDLLKAYEATGNNSPQKLKGGRAMRSHYRFGVVFAGLCFLGLTSCIDSENPLSDPAQAKPATELSGVWRERQEDCTRYYHVGLAGDKFPSGMMRMAIIDHKKDGVLEAVDCSFFLFTTTLGDRHFANITLLEPDQLKEIAKTGWKPEMFKGYWIYEYKLDGDKLSIMRMDWDQKELLIKSKKLKGTIKTGDVSFQESTENLVKLITSPDAAKLFQPAGKEDLERVK
jgi:hypothetical protein